MDWKWPSLKETSHFEYRQNSQDEMVLDRNKRVLAYHFQYTTHPSENVRIDS